MEVPDFSELEKRPLNKGTLEEHRAIEACQISNKLEERSICYRGFFEGSKFAAETIGDAIKRGVIIKEVKS